MPYYQVEFNRAYLDEYFDGCKNYTAPIRLRIFAKTEEIAKNNAMICIEANPPCSR